MSQDGISSFYGYSNYGPDISSKLYREYLKNGLSDGEAVLKKAGIDKDDAKRIGVTEVFPFEYSQSGEIEVLVKKELFEKKFIDGMVVSFNWTLNGKIRQAALVTSALVKEGEEWKFVGKFSDRWVLGSREIVKRLFKEKREWFGAKGKTGARGLPVEGEGLFSFRGLKGQVFESGFFCGRRPSQMAFECGEDRRFFESHGRLCIGFPDPKRRFPAHSKDLRSPGSPGADQSGQRWAQKEYPPRNERACGSTERIPSKKTVEVDFSGLLRSFGYLFPNETL